MDRIFVLKDGKISEEGNYQELLEAGGAFADFLVQYLTKAEDDEDLQNDVESESELESLKEVSSHLRIIALKNVKFTLT